MASKKKTPPKAAAARPAAVKKADTALMKSNGRAKPTPAPAKRAPTAKPAPTATQKSKAPTKVIATKLKTKPAKPVPPVKAVAAKTAPAKLETAKAKPPIKLAPKSAPPKAAPAKSAASVARAPKKVPPAPAALPPKVAAPARPIVAPAALAGARPAVPQPGRTMTAGVGKPASPRLTAPVAPSRGLPPRIAPTPVPPAAQVPAAPKKPVNSRHGFKTGESIVYPAHGVGRIIGIEEQEIAGISLELFVIQFEKDKMTLRVPTGKLASVGMRKLAEDGIVKKAMEILKGKARIKRTMWSRRAQEYEAKINSGDLVSIAEVVRDLYRSEAQPEQSYSERQLYEAALDRMAREIAAVDKVDERGAMQRITEVLSKSAKGRRLAEEEAAAAAAEVKAA
jgi:CarD family transcriptional regulator